MVFSSDLELTIIEEPVDYTVGINVNHKQYSEVMGPKAIKLWSIGALGALIIAIYILSNRLGGFYIRESNNY